VSESARVFLVGAGPGDTGLLTLRAVACLERADLVLYDQLVSQRALAFAPRAEKVCVSQLAEHHAERIPHIHRMMIEAARAGRVVVRLKGGDPLVFGRGGEEAQALREAGIDFEIVPGVTAALGAAAFAGIPLTHRQHASAVAFITGHEDPDKPDSLLDWPALARFPGTLVFYMGLRQLETLTAKLIEHGKEAATPAAVVQWATLPRQRTVEAPLAELAPAVRAASLSAPAVVIVGEVVSLRASVEWLEKKPLFGRSILVTRPAGQETELCSALEELGAEVVTQPTVLISEPDDWKPVDDALTRLDEFDWLVFTSVNGVDYFIRRLRKTARDLRCLGKLGLAAIGPATAACLDRYCLNADVVPSSYRAEALAAALIPLVSGKRILLARADRAREVLREELSKVARVEQVVVYSQKDVPAVDPTINEMLAVGHINFVTVTSANIARSLHRMLDDKARQAITDGRVRLVSISPVTSEAVHEVGWEVSAEAEDYTSAGVIGALVRLARSA
jgi:uroporphyrinogen III methyltransferase/synthase